MTTPHISVIIPTYNRGTSLRSAVSSVLSQTYDNLELIVVDDCSAKSVTESLSDIRDPRLKIVRHDVNQGQAAARNTGAAHARGGLLAFLDDDDTWKPQKLERQLAYMDATKVNVSLTDYSVESTSGSHDRNNSKLNTKWLSLFSCANALPSTMVIKKDIFEKMGGFDASPGLRRIEDWDFAIRLEKDREKLVIVPGLLATYSGWHLSSPAKEREVLENIGLKHAHTFAPGTTEAKTFAAGMEWKRAHLEMMQKHYGAGFKHLLNVTLRHPVSVARNLKAMFNNHLRQGFSFENRRPNRVKASPEATVNADLS